MRDPLDLPQSEVECVGLGKVVVMGMTLTERMKYLGNVDEESAPGTGALRLLSACVREPDGERIWDEQGWDRYGAQYQTEIIELINVARRMNGLDFGDNPAPKD